MEFNTAKYNEITEKIEQCVNEYEKMNFDSSRQTLYLANGDIINIKVTKNNIPHLLGVNLDYLAQSNMFKSDADAYTRLKYFLDNSYRFSRLVIDQKKLDFDLMFSDYIDEKVESFINNIKIRTDDIQFVIKYDGEKTYQLENIPDICDYYIIRKINQDYYVLGLTRYENTTNFNPVTSRKYSNEEDFEKFVSRIAKKQEITYPYVMKVVNDGTCYKKDFYIRMSEKPSFIGKLIRNAKKYDATPAVVRDFSYTLSNLNDSRSEKENVLSVLRLLADNVKSGNVMGSEIYNDVCGEFEIPDEVLELINICNDNICNGFEADNTSYTQLHDERNALKQELKSLREELTASNSEVERLTTENAELKEQNNNYNEQMNILDEAYQKIKEIKK